MIAAPTAQTYCPRIAEIRPAQMETSWGNNRLMSNWNEMDGQLAAWLSDPASAVDPDAVAPSKTSLRVARKLLSVLRLYREAPPSAVVPDGNGGVLFEWRLGRETRSIEVDQSGDAEEILIRNERWQFRRAIPIG